MGYGFTIDRETNPLQATDLINIISLFEHSAPSLHLSLRIMPWWTFHPRGAAGFIVDGNFIERRISTPYQLRSASSYIYLVLLGGETFWISNARPCIRTLAPRIRAVGYLAGWCLSISEQHIWVNPPQHSALRCQDLGHCPYHHPTWGPCEQIQVGLLRRQLNFSPKLISVRILVSVVTCHHSSPS